MEIENLISTRIKQMRLENNWTQKDLAQKLGLKNDTAIANYEAGYSTPKDDIKYKMCEIFNCSLDYLMGKSMYRNEKDFFSKNFELNQEFLEYGISEESNLIDFKQLETVVNTLSKIQNVDLFEMALKDYISPFSEEHQTKLEKYIRMLCDYDRNFTTFSNSDKKNLYVAGASRYYMCPVYGRISAGLPNWAEECIEGRLPIDPELMGILNPEEHYFLHVDGESMNKVVKNGAYALIHKQDFVENGEIAVVLVNGFDATLKKFTKQNDLIILEPQSNDDTFKTQVYDKNTAIKVLGKYVGKMEINN